MYVRVAEIILTDHLTPEGGVLPPFTQMTDVSKWLKPIALIYEWSTVEMILYAIFI